MEEKREQTYILYEKKNPLNSKEYTQITATESGEIKVIQNGDVVAEEQGTVQRFQNGIVFCTTYGYFNVSTTVLKKEFKKRKTPCSECKVCTPPYEEIRYEMSTKTPAPTPMGFPHIPDTIEYKDNAGGKTASGDYVFLGNTIDRCLLSFVDIRLKAIGEKNDFLPEVVVAEIERQSKLPSKSRKWLYLELPRQYNKKREASLFAYNAYVDILCKQLLSRRGAHVKTLSPQYMCTFFSQETLDKQSRQNKKYKEEGFDLVLKSFTLEDYIYYELITGTCFCIEACAALSLIENEYIRTICLNVLKKNLYRFLELPYIFARIALMRQFFYSASANFEGSIRYYNIDNGLSQDQLAAMAQQILDVLFNDWSSRVQGAYLCGIVVNSTTSINCPKADELQKMINGIKRPVDFAEYIAHPHYGPAMFCNPKHPGMESLLEDLRSYNVYSDGNYSKRLKKIWTPFAILCDEVRMMRTSQIKDARKETIRRRAIFRQTRPRKHKFAPRKRKPGADDASQQ